MFLVDQLDGRKSLLIAPVALILLILSDTVNQVLYGFLLGTFVVFYSLLLTIIEEFNQIDKDLSAAVLEDNLREILHEGADREEPTIYYTIKGILDRINPKLLLLFILLIVIAVVLFSCVIVALISLLYNIDDMTLHPVLMLTAYLSIVFLSIELIMVFFKTIFVLLDLVLEED